jgi:UDP-N-acetyl-alpha-D-muramoyl-L-alanyl-L-glutamate epimerase
VCAKCLFTALILAPFTAPAELRAWYGRDVFDNPDVRDGVRELWSDAKPFECVGERHEAAAAMDLLASDPAWREQQLVRDLADEAHQVATEAHVTAADYLELAEAPGIPADYAPVLARLAEELAARRKVLLDAPH